MELFRQLDDKRTDKQTNRQTDGLTELFLKSLSRLKIVRGKKIRYEKYLNQIIRICIMNGN